MTIQWDLFGSVVPADDIPNTQESRARPFGAVFAPLIRNAVVFIAAGVATSAVGSFRVKQEATSADLATFSRISIPREQSLRPTVRREQSDAIPDYALSRTTEQLAESFRSMLSPISEDDDIDIDYTFS
jgi:hypothetical protein